MPMAPYYGERNSLEKADTAVNVTMIVYSVSLTLSSKINMGNAIS